MAFHNLRALRQPGRYRPRSLRLHSVVTCPHRGPLVRGVGCSLSRRGQPHGIPGRSIARGADGSARLGLGSPASHGFFACAWPVNFAWFFAWRFASGLSGGALMVLAAPTVLAHIPAARRGLARGALFIVVCLGVEGAGT